MQTTNSIMISADLDRVFELAADIDKWPKILSHYRWVKTLLRDGDMSISEMAAWRSIIPVKWTSVQYSSRDDCKILYKHLDGLTKGMKVKWSFRTLDHIIYVSIVHDLTLDKLVINSIIGKWIVGKIFVKYIADKTLRQLKLLAEGR